METKRIRFTGTPEEVEAMIRMMDQVYRSWWNVYGGHRDASWTNEEGYNVIMSYTASYIFYNIYDVFKVVWHKMSRANMTREESYFTVVHN